MAERLTALQVADLRWARAEDAPPLDKRQLRNRGRQARGWLARRQPPIVAIPGVAGPARELLYPGELVRRALAEAPGKGNRTRGVQRSVASQAARGRGNSPGPLA